MKVLGLSCSPRKPSNTEVLVNEALDGARTEGATVDFYSVSDKVIAPCDGCATCYQTGECHIKDDMQTVYQKILAADGIIFGTPVYFYSLTSQAKAIIDRSISLRRPNARMANKVGGVIVVAGSLGIIDAMKEFYFYMIAGHMVPADYVAAYASESGSVKNDKLAMKSAWELGREIVQLARKGYEFPTEFKGGLRNYVRAKYKI